MSDAVRNVTLRVSLEYVNTEPKVNTDPAQKAVDELAEKTTKAQKAIEDATKAANDSARKATDQTLAVGDNLKRAGEGAFVFARGVAFMASSSDEDFQRMVQNVAKVQGAFDLFKGATDVIGGSVKALQSYRAASEAAAAADAARAVAANTAAAASAASATASGTAATAAGALAVAMNPVTILLVGLGALAVTAYNELIAGPREAAKAEEDYQKRLKETIRNVKDLVEQEEKAKQLRGHASQLSIIQATANAGASPAFILGEAERGMRESQARVAELQQRASGSSLSTERAQAEEQIVAELEHQQQLVQLINDTHQRDLDLLGQELQGLEAKRDLAQQAVTEEQKRMKLQAEIGRMTATERAEYEALIAAREKGQELSQSQLGRLQQLAPTASGQFVDRKFAEIGAQTGLEGRAADAFKVEQTDAEKLLAEAQKDVDQLKNEIAQQGKNVAETVREGWTQIVEILQELQPLQEEIAKIRHQQRVYEIGRAHV